MAKEEINILIIESDKTEQLKLSKALQDPSFEVTLKIAEDTDEALLMVIEQNPDLVFLEYPLKGKTGVGIIKFIQSKLPNTTIAFIAQVTDFAAEAIHLDVYDYLLRPIKKTEIKNLIEKVILKKKSNSLARINELIDKKQTDTIIRFNTIKGFIVTNPDDILYCKADGSFTELHFTNKSMETTFLYLSQVDEILNHYNFIRISRSIIVNKNYMRKINFKTNTVTLSFNGEECEIIGSRVTLREFEKFI